LAVLTWISMMRCEFSIDIWARRIAASRFFF